MKIHLVDGTFELFRCFHATPRATDADGREIGAARGFIHTMAALLRRPDVTHVAVTFDTVVDAPLSEDKGDGPWNQHSIAAEIIRALGIVLWPMIRRYEADDALASAAGRFWSEPGVDQVVICTRDKDLAQAVRGERVVMWDRVNDVVSDEVAITARWGVPPDAIPDLLALMGDPADGLPGLPGWGRTSAAALLARYGTIEKIPVDPAHWDVSIRGAARLGRVLAKRRSEALLYRDLIELATDVPIRETVADLEWGGAHRARVGELVDRLDVPEVIEGISHWSD